ncbi:hypothetical protein SBA2_360020 [Acidobacteriia bacterium SbA2]|nr:hypothetical protein SBA2_360020 [Acidobacteriia bacterium SbA2]
MLFDLGIGWPVNSLRIRPASVKAMLHHRDSGAASGGERSERAQDDTFWALSRLFSMDVPSARVGAVREPPLRERQRSLPAMSRTIGRRRN